MTHTNLSNIYDHPANVLRASTHPGDHITTAVAEKVLRAYEQSKDVTFTALDNDTLALIREAWDEWSTAENDNARLHGIDGLINGVRDLLGLEG